MEWNVVHVRINDAATGKPMPARVRFATPDGRYLPPLGRAGEPLPADRQDLAGNVLVDGSLHAYVEGSFEIRLPAGPIDVAISRGPEFATLRQTIVRKLGQMTLRFNLDRSADLASEGWLSGDVAAHHLSPAAAGLEGAAEGLNFVNVLAYETPTQTFPNLLDFSGQQTALARDDCQVFVNTANDGGAAGRLFLLNAHRVVFPLRLGQVGFERYTLADWCQQCHRKGGLVVRPLEDVLPADDETWQRIDAVAWLENVVNVRESLDQWYALLNRGLRLALVGGSGKRDQETALGSLRTYARLPTDTPPSYAGWIEAIRGGRTLVTRGPFIEVDCGGKGPGGIVQGSGKELQVHAAARMKEPPPGARLDLVADGEVRSACDLSDEGKAAFVIESPSQCRWLAVRGWLGEHLWFHASPTYVHWQ